MKLIANRQLTGVYGTVVAGEEFQVDDEIALQLIGNQVAHKADPPKIEYEIKVIRPEETPEVSPREPFCHVPVPDETAPTVAPESNRILPQSDIPTTGDADRRRRRRRKGSGS